MGLRWVGRLAVAGLFLAGCGVKSCAARKCRDGAACARDGECSARLVKTGDGPWRCFAGSDEDCAGSDGCRDDGKCFATETGECVRAHEVEAHRCEKAPVCTKRGDCRPSGEGFCVAVDAATCKASELCEAQGACRFAEGGSFGRVPRCVVADAADCEGSTGCRAKGDCDMASSGEFSGSGACAPSSAKHCEQSAACAEEGACDFLEGGVLRKPRCGFIPASDADCADSPGCRERGACAMVPGDASSDPPQCAPTEQRHCEASKGCRIGGACNYFPRTTVKNRAPPPGGTCEVFRRSP